MVSKFDFGSCLSKNGLKGGSYVERKARRPFSNKELDRLTNLHIQKTVTVTYHLELPLSNNSVIDPEWIQPLVTDVHLLYLQPKFFFLSFSSSNKVICLWYTVIILGPLSKLLSIHGKDIISCFINYLLTFSSYGTHKHGFNRFFLNKQQLLQINAPTNNKDIIRLYVYIELSTISWQAYN